MSKKEELPTSTQDFLKAIGTKNQLKKKLQSLPTDKIVKLNKTFAEATEEIQIERQKKIEKTIQVQNAVQKALIQLSEEHGIPLDEVKSITTQL